MRRRLTVTGASENIDGGVEKNHVEEEPPKQARKNKVRHSKSYTDAEYSFKRWILKLFFSAAFPFFVWAILIFVVLQSPVTTCSPLRCHGIFGRIQERTRPLQSS